MDRLRAMRVFAAIAQAGSLTAASRLLGMPLTNVSRSLTALERELRVPLFVRTTRMITLTDNGREYLQSCRSILDEVTSAEARLRGKAGEPRGELAITAPVAFGRLHVLPAVTAYLDKFPDVSVRMLLVDRTIDLMEEGIDVAIRIGHLADSQMRTRTAGSVTQIVCASPKYLKAHGEPRTPAQLKEHACITFSGMHLDSTEWVFGKGRQSVRVKVRSRLTVNSAEAAVDAAVQGIGVARVLSYQAADAIARGRLRRILVEHEPPAVPVSVIHREGRQQQAKVQEFVKFATAVISPRLSLTKAFKRL